MLCTEARLCYTERESELLTDTGEERLSEGTHTVLFFDCEKKYPNEHSSCPG
jgi:hypothetical protein